MSELMNNISQILRNPSSNLVAATIGVGIVVVIAIIIVLVLVSLALPNTRKKRRKKQSSKVQRETKARRRMVLTWTLIGLALGILAAALMTFALTSRSSFCADACHAMSDPANSWEESTHASVACVRCHEGLPVLSTWNGMTGRIRSLLRAMDTGGLSGTHVSSHICLDCHSNVMREVLLTDHAVHVSHLEIIEGGGDCGDCHPRRGHTDTVEPIPMSACLRCHDDTVAFTDCDGCHPDGPDASIRYEKPTVGSPANASVIPDCAPCHGEPECNECHGLKMPHPDGFEEAGSHGSLAAFDRKQMCFECHPRRDCDGCHLDFDAHGAAWITAHQAYAEGSAWCAECHEVPADASNFCAVCHL